MKLQLHTKLNSLSKSITSDNILIKFFCALTDFILEFLRSLLFSTLVLRYFKQWLQSENKKLLCEVVEGGAGVEKTKRKLVEIEKDFDINDDAGGDEEGGGGKRRKFEFFLWKTWWVLKLEILFGDSLSFLNADRVYSKIFPKSSQITPEKLNKIF